MKLKIKKLHEDAIIPQYAHIADSGMDLVSMIDIDISPGGRTLIPTGIAIELPEGTEGQIRSRSGLAIKHSIVVLNSPGTIDFSYRGEIKVILANLGYSSFAVTKGMKIAQLVICPVLHPTIEVVEELGQTVRGNNGFGSTGV